MPQVSKRNHYLPEFYIRAWTTPPDGTVWQYSRVHSGRLNEQCVTPKATGFKMNLYSAVDGVTNQRPDSIERDFFGPIDRAAAAVHKKLASGSREKLTDDERLAWARFLNSLLERDPSTLGGNDDKAKPIGDQVAEEMLAGCSADSRERIAEVLTPELKATMVKYIVRHNMVREIDAPDVLRYLTDQVWRVLTLGDNVDLLTSDLPLIVNGTSERRFPIQTLAVALSPKSLFVAYPARWDLDDEMLRATVLAYNFALIGGHGRFLYSHVRLEDGRILRLRTAAENAFGIPAVTAAPSTTDPG